MTFGLETIEEILRHAKPVGHHEDGGSHNLGFGFLYYSLARLLRPRHVVVIGSGYGFSVVCLALGLRDNAAGRLTFVDPSYSLFRNGPLRTLWGRGNWDTPEQVHERFCRFGIDRIVTHHKLTSAEFFERYPTFDLPVIDLAFIDGSKRYEDTRDDFNRVVAHARANSYVAIHDTHAPVREKLVWGVKKWVNQVKEDSAKFEVVDFPFDSGVAIIRLVEPRRAT